MRVKNVAKPSDTGMILSDSREPLGISSVSEAFCMSLNLIKQANSFWTGALFVS